MISAAGCLKNETISIRSRLRAGFIHLLLSTAVAAGAAVVVFGLWFPGPYRSLAGGIELFTLVVGVDVGLGPLLTTLVFDKRKGWRYLKRDLLIIGLIQVSALAYGLHAVYEARPVALVFEVDRFRVITEAQVYLPELKDALKAYRHLPLTGPWLLGTRQAVSVAEHNESLVMGFEGIDIGQRPSFWVPYAESASKALARAKPVSALAKRYPAQISKLSRSLIERGLDPAQVKFLSVVGRKTDGIMILDAAGLPTTFLPLDGFV